MTKDKILSFIKTQCGREKYFYLKNQKGILAKVRLLWFIIIASLRDWNLNKID